MNTIGDVFDFLWIIWSKNTFNVVVQFLINFEIQYNMNFAIVWLFMFFEVQLWKNKNFSW